MAAKTYESWFVGVDSHDDDAPPGWATSILGLPQHGSESFNETIQTLPTAEERRVAYDSEPSGTKLYQSSPSTIQSGRWREDSRHIALVNPAWLGDGIDDAPNETAVWHIPTSSYTPVTPIDAYGPLGAAIRRFGIDDLGPVVGSVRQYRYGGEVHMDVLFDGLRAGAHDEFVLGIQTGYDFFGATQLYAEVVAYDTRDGTELRGLTDKRTRRHVGSAHQAVGGWWYEILGQLETAADSLAEAITAARQYDVDFSAYPFDVTEFYALLGFSDSLAETAAERVVPPSGQSRAVASAWTLYHGMAEALTHDYDGKDASSTTMQYINTTTDILFAPPAAVADALEAKERQLTNQATLTPGDERAADVLADQRKSIAETIDTYKDTRERFAALLSEAGQ